MKKAYLIVAEFFQPSAKSTHVGEVGEERGRER
jgi:hypothetical protein